MPKVSLLLPAAASLFIFWSGVPARADSLSCISVNGKTVCTGSEAMHCRSVDGRTDCAQGSSTSCATVGGHTVCRSGGMEMPQDEDRQFDDAAPMQPPPSGESGPQKSWTGPDRPNQTLSIERNGQRLRIRNGALDLRLE